MIDLYADDMKLSEIQNKYNTEILVFSNEPKDESLRIPVSDEELKNIYSRIKMRCETRGLIPIRASVVDEISQFLQNSGYEDASKAIDCMYEL